MTATTTRFPPAPLISTRLQSCSVTRASRPPALPARCRGPQPEHEDTTVTGCLPSFPAARKRALPGAVQHQRGPSMETTWPSAALDLNLVINAGFSKLRL